MLKSAILSVDRVSLGDVHYVSKTIFFVCERTTALSYPAVNGHAKGVDIENVSKME